MHETHQTTKPRQHMKMTAPWGPHHNHRQALSGVLGTARTWPRGRDSRRSRRSGACPGEQLWPRLPFLLLPALFFLRPGTKGVHGTHFVGSILGQKFSVVPLKNLCLNAPHRGEVAGANPILQNQYARYSCILLQTMCLD